MHTHLFMYSTLRPLLSMTIYLKYAHSQIREMILKWIKKMIYLPTYLKNQAAVFQAQQNPSAKHHQWCFPQFLVLFVFTLTSLLGKFSLGVTKLASCWLPTFWKKQWLTFSNSSNKGTTANSFWNILGHGSIPKSVIVAWKMKCSYQLIWIMRSLLEPEGSWRMESAHPITWLRYCKRHRSLKEDHVLTYRGSQMLARLTQ